MPRPALKLAVLAALAVLTLPACSSGPYKSSPGTPTASAASPTESGSPMTSGTATESGSPSAAPVAGTQIVISKFLYAPVNLQVKPGAKVTVVNQDPVAHTVTAESDHRVDAAVGQRQPLRLR